MRFRDDSRGASIAVNHALTLGITTVLISGLILGAGSQLGEQQDRVIREGLRDVGESTVNELYRIDRLAQGNVNNDVVSEVPYPNRVGGETYELRLEETATGARLIAHTADGTKRVPIEFQVQSEICEREVNGGPVGIIYDTNRDCLTLAPRIR